ncbi:WD repeat-containing protein 6 [Nymphon striatum]|nr:WD repeat-containing protein 6 [Nymphon striatum]
MAVISAHNIVWLWEPSTNRIIKDFHSDLQCILYSAHFIGHKWNELVVATGTVFQEVVLWSPSICYDSKKLCSTSDDRSVHVRSVTFSSNSSIQYPSAVEWKQATFTLLHVLYGHEARVWRSIIISDYVLTIGEDSHLCVWNDQGVLCKKVHMHKGAGIWSICATSTSECLITGGGDGGIDIWNLNKDILKSANDLSCLSFQDCVKSHPIVVSRMNQRIITVLENGSVLVYDKIVKCWKTVLSDSLYSSYCVMASSPNGIYLAIGTIAGTATIHDLRSDFREIVRFSDDHGKIFNIAWLNNVLLITCGCNGMMTVWELTSEEKIKIKYNLTLPKCKQRWFSAAVLFQYNVVIGDRNGSIHIYSTINQVTDPKQSFKHIHGHLGVTDLKLNDDLMYSTGRNGLISIFSCNQNNIIMLRSFKTKFVVWSMEQHRCLFEIQCGGGHRSWNYSIAKETDDFLHQFVCIKDKKVWEVQVSHVLYGNSPKVCSFRSTLKSCVHVLYCTLNQMIYVTGSEDTTVKIFHVNQSNNIIHVKDTLTSHVSSIKAVFITEFSRSDHSRIMVTAGGRAQFIIWKIIPIIDSPNFVIEELKNYMLEKSITNMHSKNKNNDLKQIRFMDVCITTPKEVQEHLSIFAACSDGTIRSYWLQVKIKALEERKSFVHGDNCVLKLVSFQIACLGDILLSGGTDGVICIWAISFLEDSEYFKAALEIEHHQSGVNALAVSHISESTVLVGSGGDDNAIALSFITFDVNNSHPCVQSTMHFAVPSAHASQITGFKFLSGSDKEYFITASVDQRLILWKCSILNDILDIIQIKTIISSVSDISSLDVIGCESGYKAAVGGEGFEEFDISVAELHKETGTS